MKPNFTRVPVTANLILKGVGQIMLQENAWTGLFFLAGTFCTSFTIGIASVVATITGTATAKLMKYPHEKINSGLYGFNAALVGVALMYFFQPHVLVWMMVITGSAISTIIHHLLIKRNFPSYTFPFIVVIWLALAIAAWFPDTALQPVAANGDMPVQFSDLFSYSFAQVIFQDNNLAGYLFIIGVVVSRPPALLYAAGGIVISALVAFVIGAAAPEIYMGIWSYNAVLCAIVFTGPVATNGWKALLSVVWSVLVLYLMKKLNLPALTFPFVLGTWITLLIPLGYKKNKKTDT